MWQAPRGRIQQASTSSSSTKKAAADRRDSREVTAQEVPIGASKDKVTVVETATEFVLNGVTLAKAEMAQVCKCEPDDKCWAVGLSTLGWPLCLRLCQHPGSPGHESHTSSAHDFTEEQIAALSTLYKAAAAAKRF